MLISENNMKTSTYFIHTLSLFYAMKLLVIFWIKIYWKLPSYLTNCTCDGSFSRKKFLKIETPEKVSKVNYVKGRLNGLAICNIEIIILDIIDHDTIIFLISLIMILSLMFLHQEIPGGVFLWRTKVFEVTILAFFLFF